MSMPEATLSVNGLYKRFGTVTALDGLTLALPAGEIYGLLGPNGAGKTTLLRIVCGVLSADAGEGQCLGMPVGAAAPAGLGYIPQRGGLYDDLSVAENLRFFARAHGLASPRRVVTQALAAHDLNEKAGQRVGTLSGGWRQRTALAAALLHAPRLVLLDEPTAGLDTEARERLWARLRNLSAHGTTLLVTTHYADEAERCDRIGYLTSGRLRAQGAPGSLAAELGLAVWRIQTTAGTPHSTPPEIAGIRFSRDADGWRAVCRATSTPPTLAAW